MAFRLQSTALTPAPALTPTMQKAGRWQHSLQVFGQMEAAGVEPDVAAHNAAIAAHARG